MKIGEVTGNTRDHLICNGKLVDFRATLIELETHCDSEEVVISEQTAKHLMVEQGDTVRVTKLVRK